MHEVSLVNLEKSVIVKQKTPRLKRIHWLFITVALVVLIVVVVLIITKKHDDIVTKFIDPTDNYLVTLLTSRGKL